MLAADEKKAFDAMMSEIDSDDSDDSAAQHKTNDRGTTSGSGVKGEYSNAKSDGRGMKTLKFVCLYNDYKHNLH